MKRLAAVLICIALFPAISMPDRGSLPAVAADTVTIRNVRRASGFGTVTEFGHAVDVLLVERPVDAREHATASVFVVDEDGAVLQRARVEYGRSSMSFIQIVSGVSPGDRIVVSDMRAWDRFDRIRLR